LNKEVMVSEEIEAKGLVIVAVQHSQSFLLVALVHHEKQKVCVEESAF
jgi:hypothetical protein